VFWYTEFLRLLQIEGSSYTKNKALFVQLLFSLHDFIKILCLVQPQKDTSVAFNYYKTLPIMCLQPHILSINPNDIVFERGNSQARPVLESKF
jgi:hypothetical protein